MTTHRLFVGNLSFHTGEDAVRDLFAAHAPSSVELVLDRETGRSRGFGFVAFADAAAAAAAMTATNGAVLDGRALRIDAAAERAPRDHSGGGRDRSAARGGRPNYVGSAFADHSGGGRGFGGGRR